MDLYVGTSGYSYKGWKGPFYPEKLAASKMLGYYAERLSSVEINNTFYRMPKSSVLESWREQVPDGFRFAIKASRRITHFKRLRDTNEEMGFLLGNLKSLGDRLGVVLFQLPPNFKCDVERLSTFLELLPADVPAVFEFRHDSWRCDEAEACLRERDLAWVIVDQEDADEPDLVATSKTGYLRLRRPDYDTAALDAWAGRVLEQDWERAFVYFKHEDAGAGPRLAAAFGDAVQRLAELRRPRTVRRRAAAERQVGS